MAPRRTMADSMPKGFTPQQKAFLHKHKQDRVSARKQENKETDLETFTVRLPSAVTSGVRRVVMKRKLAGEKDLTQQEVVREVLRKWLQSEGEAA